jgi:hypothetical protein
MKISSIPHIPLSFGILTLLLAGCDRTASRHTLDSEISAWIGETVRVQFRRDALGAAATLPISPNTSTINGAETTLIGKLIEVHSSSIVIEEADRQKWIPREVILFVQAPL